MFAQRLKLARKKAGFSLEELAQKADISKQAISKYENDKMMPSSSVLIRLARELDVSFDFLLGGQVSSLEKIEFRKESDTKERERAQAEAVMTESIENYLTIEAILGKESNADLFEDITRDSVASFAEADALAIKLRDAWDLGNNPIPSMSHLLERKGMKLVQTNLPDRVHALTCDVKLVGDRHDIHAIALGSGDNVERRRFNLAHELGHKIILSTSNPKIKLEKLIDRFAGAFLVNADHLREIAGEKRYGITLAELVQLKYIYGVSAAAMLVRLSQAGILPEKYVKRLFQGRALKWRKEEPHPITDNRFDEKPHMYELLVWRALGDKLIPPIRAAKLLGEPLADIESKMQTDVPDRSREERDGNF